MSLHQVPKSDRRAIGLLLGLITFLVILSFYHSESQSPLILTEDTQAQKTREDSINELRIQKQLSKEQRERRYQEIRDSFAELKMLRTLQRQRREAAYLARKDSFAQLKAEREKKKEVQERAWKHWHDSIQKLSPQKFKIGQILALNKADSLQLLQIPGIGKGLAAAIIRYRDRLGGFYQKEQILEINGITEEVIPYLSIDTTYIRKLAINKLSISQLRKHPYINFYQAKAIWNYRQKYGNIKNLKQLSLLDEFPEEELTRLAPYVSY